MNLEKHKKNAGNANAPVHPKRKPLEELTITDDFMFGAVMSNPALCKPLLELILCVKIARIEYPELQKVIDEAYDSKSIRLDVYVQDEEHTVYNVEMQVTFNKNLSKRMRFYQGLIDLDIISKGQDYGDLKKSFVIFICTFDPYGKGRYIYTFENRCNEDNSLKFGDDTMKVVVNTKGRVGDISDELKQLIEYLDGKEPQGDYAKKLDKEVGEVKKNRKWRREYMKLMIRDMEQKKIGRYSHLIHQVRGNKNKIGKNELADILMSDENTIDTISNLIDEHPEWDDEDIAYELVQMY